MQILDRLLRHNHYNKMTVIFGQADRIREDASNGPGEVAERAVLVENAKITPLVHGSGLGLWLGHQVVTQSGGSLDFHENDPRGSVVEIRLPAVNVLGSDGHN